MKSAWLSLVLHEGLGFPKDTISLHSIASMEGQSVQWALGALLYNTRYLPLRLVGELECAPHDQGGGASVQWVALQHKIPAP